MIITLNINDRKENLIQRNVRNAFIPGEVARGIFRPHNNLFFSSLHISWNYNLTFHIPFATFLPLS